ncbi:MAG: hypothetical protein ABSA40_05750 [Candidatus Dormibacteria bacterium]|jgi:hypothetical protein
MTKGLRWRIMTLQAGLILVLALAAVFLIWSGNYSRGSVEDQLASQEITFPAANDASITALPAADATAMRQYAGETMTTGDQAEVWANDYIKVHLGEIGLTYSQASALARANPTSAADAATEATVFQGTTLRSMLLNAYGWWTIGTYALDAGIGMAVAAFVVLLALAFEVWRWRLAVREEGFQPVITPAQVTAKAEAASSDRTA